VIQIQATVDLFTYPYRMLAVNLSGDICHPLGTEWQLIDGYFSQQNDPLSLSILAQLGPSPNRQIAAQEIDFTSCAQTFFAVSWRYQGPDSYLSIFSYEDYIWTCNILFKGWQACS
jgi:hypothetical protein